MANRKNTFLLKRSNIAGKIPSSGDLLLGELALNTADNILYASGTTANSILPIGWDRVARTGDTMTGNFNFIGDLSINGSSLPSGYALSVTGDTTVGGQLKANSVSATTYYNLPTDVRVTGGTYSTGTATFTNNTGGTFTVTGFSDGGGGTFSGGTVTGPTNFTDGLTANTISATTYYNLPLDIRTTGTTVSNGSIAFNRNDSMSAYTVSFSGVNINVISDDVNKRLTFSASTNGGSSLPTLNQAQIFIGDTSNVAQARDVSGDVSIDYSGLTTIQSHVVSYDKIQLVTQNALLGSPNVSGGTVEEIPMIDGYITTGATVSDLLDDITNWDINGEYTGTTITGTYQGQSHYNPNYWFTAVDDNVWIRLIRG
jgi:hypothetical protein